MASKHFLLIACVCTIIITMVGCKKDEIALRTTSGENTSNLTDTLGVAISRTTHAGINNTSSPTSIPSKLESKDTKVKNTTADGTENTSLGYQNISEDIVETKDTDTALDSTDTALESYEVKDCNNFHTQELPKGNSYQPYPFANIEVAGKYRDKIYFIAPFGYGLFVMSPDGTNQSKISNSYGSQLRIENSKLYFINETGKKIVSMKIDGTDEKLFYSEEKNNLLSNFQVDAYYMYFYNGKDYVRISLADSNKKEIILSGEFNLIYPYNGSVYYSNNDKSIWSYDIKNQKQVCVKKDIKTLVKFIPHDGWLYYNDSTSVMRTSLSDGKTQEICKMGDSYVTAECTWTPNSTDSIKTFTSIDSMDIDKESNYLFVCGDQRIIKISLINPTIKTSVPLTKTYIHAGTELIEGSNGTQTSFGHPNSPISGYPSRIKVAGNWIFYQRAYHLIAGTNYSFEALKTD